ncbi:mitochondrial carrier domain-containing protein [Apiosordaria backusii]|uniref:Mitochondrial carrier domain-containing protein n=1 Tax=Apiosordaria backusii TaxID=314023 RepID=A0AA40AT23_9PEZI|nr:mitochondrial carrier domain-containing protein [Apiosordaria backusii]
MAAPTTPHDLALPEPAPTSGASQTFKDLFSGAAGGIAQVLIGKPTLRHSKSPPPNLHRLPLRPLRRFFHLPPRGPSSLLQRNPHPLLGIGACVSIQFGAFHSARRYLESITPGFTPGSSQLSYSQYYAAGAFAGVANSVISGPIEHVRIRLQTQPHGEKRLYSGPLDCVKTLTRQGGLGGGLYRGQAVTVIREAQAYGLWFLAFEWLMNSDAKRNKIERKEVPSWKVALYGGLAGEALWLGSYPFDVVKSKMQTDGFGPGQQKYKTMRDCFAQVWRQEGVRGFWKGLGPTLLRAMPVSAGTFAVVEMTMRAIN